jgi:hypothetical protein
VLRIPKNAVQCFYDRLISEGRWQEFSESRPIYPKPETRPHDFDLKDYYTAEMNHKLAFGYNKHQEFRWFLMRLVARIAADGRSAAVRECCDYLEEMHVMWKELRDAARKIDDQNLSMADQFAWLQNNWFFVMEEHPTETGKFVPNIEALRESRSRGVFQLAAWAAVNPDEFMKECLRLLAVPKKLAGTKKEEEDGSVDAKSIQAKPPSDSRMAADLKNYIRQHG